MINNLKAIIEKYSSDYDNITAYVSFENSRTVQLNGFETESVDISNDAGISVRVLKEGRTAAIAYDGTDAARAYNFLNEYRSLITQLPFDKNACMPQIAHPAGSLDLFDAENADIGADALIEMAKTVTDSAMTADKRMKAVKQSIVSASKNSLTILQPFAEPLVSHGTSFSAMAYAIADDGGERDAYGTAESVYLHDLDLAAAGREAAISACSLLNAKKLKTARYGVLFSADVMAEFAELMTDLLNGENIYKNISMFSGKLGKDVASGLFTVTDEPMQKRGTGSCLFDDEGQAASDITLIGGGKLISCLTNSGTAKALGIKNSANARLSHSGNMSCGYSNLKIKPTTDKIPYDFMTEYVKVTEVMGMHTADTISGDFSVGIAGIVYKNGEPLHPFREAVLTGNLKYLLDGLIAVFNNEKTVGSITCSDALFDKMTVSGE